MKSRLLLLLFFLALQPLQGFAARPRVLLLDKNMSPWQMLVPSAQPWIASGCDVFYRQFHPYLVQDDLDNYDILVLLGGRTPLLPSARITREDVDLLKEFHARGKGLVLGYPYQPTGEGADDRAAFNQLLRELQSHIQIGEVPVEDQAHRYVTTTDQKVFVRRQAAWQFNHASRLALGPVLPLQIGEGARVEVVAEAYESATIRKEKTTIAGPFAAGLISAGRAPVLLLSRHALGISGASLFPDNKPMLAQELADSTVAFVTAVCQRYLKVLSGAQLQLTPITPNSAIPTRAESRLPSLPAMPRVVQREPYPVEAKQLTRAHLPDNDLLTLSEHAYVERLDGTTAEKLLREGVRMVNGRLPALYSGKNMLSPAKTTSQLDSLAAFLQQSGTNLFWGVANPQALTAPADYDEAARKSLLQLWRETAKKLQPSPASWLLGVDFRDLRLPAGQTLGMDGIARDIWPPLDRRVWWQGFIKPLELSATFMAQHRASMGGILLDLEFYGNPALRTYLMGHDFSDATFNYFLVAADGFLDAELHAQAQSLPASARYTFLLRNGLLPLYYATLQDEAERFGRLLRRRIDAIAPNLLWGVYTHALPANWFVCGLLRGLSRPEQPVILLSLESQARRYLAWLREEEIYAVHAVAVSPWLYRPSDYPDLFAFIHREHHGYWLSSLELLLDAKGVVTADGPIGAGQLARVLRNAWEQVVATNNK